MSGTNFITETTWRLVDDPARLPGELAPLAAETLIGLDTETYWEAAARRSRVSLVQLAAAAGDVLVVDVLATGVEPLRALVESPALRMVAHNARFDDGVLRAAGLAPQGFIDTLPMSRAVLSLASHSLAAVTEHLFGLPLDKTLQKSNWRRRPLTRAQLAYAARDARVTLRVYEELKRLLAERGLLERVLAAAEVKPGEPRAPRRRRTAAPAPFVLTPEDKRVVTRLKKWRLERAHAQRVPAYMICSDRTLEHLARERPASLEALAGIYGLGESKIKSLGEALLEALRAASE
ncbi:MAG TPA: HRDC domain-containing protein [Pyrinomonadaceae bacterium]|nr:HRDC domain-containing protein [Pyrinomonadaceae bacterium]